MIVTILIALQSIGAQANPPDRICNMKAFVLDAMSPKAGAPSNWYRVLASATTDRQTEVRKLNVQALLYYSYVTPEGLAARGTGTVILRGEGSAGTATVALDGDFGAMGRTGLIDNVQIQTSLCLTDLH